MPGKHRGHRGDAGRVASTGTLRFCLHSIRPLRPTPRVADIADPQFGNPDPYKDLRFDLNWDRQADVDAVNSCVGPLRDFVFSGA